ncbi:glutathione ABC transporter substrate-binding protein [Geomicrobium sp. JSM 1781026]|uniref:glutathione ABC transporter substrate-binding protein n=1 Tax=Geomicrobium sp. JSM 1781026 TaxID=3344580 RepID=UPI0035C001D1
MRHIRFVFLLSALFMIAGCSTDLEETPNQDTESEADANADSASEPTAGGELTMAIPADITDLDAHGASDRTSGTVKLNVYETLVAPDENMDLQPLLAESYEQLDDHTWEFILEQDVTFHDGETFNAEAVKANFDRVLDPEVASPMASQFNMIEQVEVINDHVVHIVTEEPFLSLPNNLSHFGGGIISPKAMEDEAAGNHNLDLHPVGTGPFIFDSWDQGNSIAFTKHDDYWGEEAHLDHLTYQIVPEQSTRIAMLDTGEVHIADDIEPVNSSLVESMTHANLLATESMRSNYFGFNVQSEPFDDPTVRQAIAAAIDTDSLVEGLYGDYGSKATAAINEFIFGYNPNAAYPAYNVDEAQALLSETDVAGGFSTTLWVEESDALALQAGEYIQDRLKETLNIDVSLQQLEWGTLLSETADGQHDMSMLGWSNNLGDPNDALYRQFHSANFGGPGNRMFYENEDVDEMLIEARQESDDAHREELYQDVQTILAEDVPRIDFVNPNYILGVHADVQGFQQFASEHHSFREVYLEESSNGEGY